MYSVNTAIHSWHQTEDEDDIYNLLTKEVMTETVSQDILERDEIGQRMFVEFDTESLTEGRL